MLPALEGLKGVLRVEPGKRGRCGDERGSGRALQAEYSRREPEDQREREPERQKWNGGGRVGAHWL